MVRNYKRKTDRGHMHMARIYRIMGPRGQIVKMDPIKAQKM